MNEYRKLDIHRSLREGQRLYRAMKMRRRAEWLRKLEMTRRCKWRPSGEPCQCGESHQGIELVLFGEVVDVLCPRMYRLRIAAMHIEYKHDLTEWLKKYPSGYFTKSLENDSG